MSLVNLNAPSRKSERNMQASILIVDDEEGIRESLGALLRDEGYEVESAASGEECLERMDRKHFDLVLLDVWLKKIDGLETLAQIQSRDAAPIVVMISGHGNIETAVRATKLGAFDFIEKPLSLGKFILVVRNALEYMRLEAENQRLRAQLEERHQILGTSIPMKALRQQIALTAPTNGRVLIYGESGTGKELVARALHGSSARSSMPFVEVNCAAIPEELIESEMFGHRKGSFTGASEDKVGKFQKADGGTLFLDEIGDMSMKTQSKVLRVLEEQRVEPLGSNQPVNVDVRVLAATNKKLEDEIARERFSRGFVLPAERDSLLCPGAARAHRGYSDSRRRIFWKRSARSMGRSRRNSARSAMEVLLAYPWPGNVRELKNLVERLVIMCPSAKIEPHHLPPEVFRGVSKSPQKPYESLQEARSAYEREFVLRKLEENRWNMTKAAEALGLERSHLYRKMRSLGIAPSKAS